MNDFFPFFPIFFIPARSVPGDECGFEHSTQSGTAHLSSAQHAACISAAASQSTCRPMQAERISASTDIVPYARCAVSRFLFLRIA
jgi:hypothetical protein